MVSFISLKRAAMTTLMVLTVPLATFIISFHIVKKSTMASDLDDEQKDDSETSNKIVLSNRQIVNRGLLCMNSSGEVITINNSNIYMRESHNFQCNGQGNTAEGNNTGRIVGGNGYVPSPCVNGRGKKSAAGPDGQEGPTGSLNDGTVCHLSSNIETRTRSLGWTVEKGGSSANVLNPEEEVKKFFPPPTRFDE